MKRMKWWLAFWMAAGLSFPASAEMTNLTSNWFDDLVEAPLVTCQALVIANGNYKRDHQSINNAAGGHLMVGALMLKGFEVTLLQDQEAKKIEEAIAQLGKSDADVLWLAYVGDGQMLGEEHDAAALLGVDMQPTKPLEDLLITLAGNKAAARIVTLAAKANNGMTHVPEGMVVQWAGQPVSMNTNTRAYALSLVQALLNPELSLTDILPFIEYGALSTPGDNAVKQHTMTVFRVKDFIWNSLADGCGNPRKPMSR